MDKDLVLEIPEEMDIWNDIPPEIKKDLAVWEYLSGETIREFILEAIIVSLEGSFSSGSVPRDYREQIEKIKARGED